MKKRIISSILAIISLMIIINSGYSNTEQIIATWIGISMLASVGIWELFNLRRD